MSSCFGGIQKKFIELFGGFIRVQHHSQVREMIVFFFFFFARVLHLMRTHSVYS